MILAELFAFLYFLNAVTCDNVEAIEERTFILNRKVECDEKCFSKCCPKGMINKDFGIRLCANVKPNDTDIVMTKKVAVYDGKGKVEEIVLPDHFTIVTGLSCKIKVPEDKAWHIQQDGKLYMDMPTNIPPWTVRGPEKYCIDTFVYNNPDGSVTEKLDALVCFQETVVDNSNMRLSASCMLISCIFILMTVAVYAWLPELRNLHGRVLMAYLLSFFVAFLSLATMQILLLIGNITTNFCLVLTFIIYYFLESAFFWLNIMSFDIWWTFSGKRGLSLEKLSTRARFCAYAAYAFGVPTVLTVIMAILEFADIAPHLLLPNIKKQGCFLYGTSKLIYLYGPIMVLCVANMIFFILTALKIAQIRKQTSVLKSNESTTHDQTRNNQQRLLLYVKLFAVMGINWVLEVISSLYPEANWLFQYTDAYNVLIGLIIFIIFVCKRKIFLLIKKRYKHLRGYQMSRTVTASTRTVSSRDDIRLSSIKNNNN